MARPGLRCWWDGLHVADITPRRPWDLRLRYTGKARERWAANTPVLSCSLPLQTGAVDASAFLTGLLPEGRHRQALAALAGVATNDVYGLLARYGRDVAGALVITEDEHPPDRDRWSVVPYTEATLAAEVIGLDDQALGVHSDSELSIAGLQNKLLLVELDDGEWGRPAHGYPSTHILKVDDERYPGLVSAEADCLQLAQRIGLTEGDPVTSSVGGQDCIIVRRYDRIIVDGAVDRLHQEDVCQALGIDPTEQRGRKKYEKAGGPALADIARLLLVHAADPSVELERLLAAATFTGLIGNADAHGKNLSLLHDGDGHITLAPLYDTVPTVLWPQLRREGAMSINGKWLFEKVTVADLVDEADGWGLDRGVARAVVTKVAEGARAHVGSTVTTPDLASLVTTRSERFLRERRAR